MDDLDEIVAEFIVESHENLDQLDRDLLALEREPGSPDLLASVFRTIHTIKGTSGLLTFSRLESVTHAGESLLSLLRDGTLELDESRTDALLDLVDAVRDLLTTIERTGAEGSRDLSWLVERLRALQAPAEAAPAEPSGPLIGDLLVAQGVVTEDDVADALLMQQRGDTRRLGEILVEKGKARAAATEAAAESQAQARRSIAASTIRVDVARLDALTGLAGTLARTRDEVVAAAGRLGDEQLRHAARRLDRVTGDLQDGVAKTRLQPIETVWNRLPRLVRDLSHACGRQVRLEMVGRHTELDRTVLEAVRDPITHLVRNAVDHGIEPPEVRRAAGKPPEGTLALRAFRDCCHATIEVRDDGSGIDPDRVAASAVARGAVPASRLAGMSRHEVLGLVFAPGVSTAPAVTSVSGRGVGMDVVRTNVEAVGGTVDVASEPGVGTTVVMRIPLTRTRTGSPPCTH